MGPNDKKKRLLRLNLVKINKDPVKLWPYLQKTQKLVEPLIKARSQL